MERTIIIRQETQEDYKETEKLTEEAFRDLELSGHNEHLLFRD